MNQKKLIIAAVAVLIIGAILVWAFMASVKPLPGQELADLGRGHVAIGTKIDYNSNPPTSGPHYEVWTKPGIYNAPPDDRNLVHSLEHGYIIMSYNCDFKTSGFRLIKEVQAHGVGEEATGSGEVATDSAKLSDNFRSDDCHKLVDQLISIYEKKGKRKLIITPRPSLDSKIALTAWRRIDKFNEFDEFDAARIENFIDQLRDKGPEQTMEPPGT